MLLRVNHSAELIGRCACVKAATLKVTFDYYDATWKAGHAVQLAQKSFVSCANCSKEVVKLFSLYCKRNRKRFTSAHGLTIAFERIITSRQTREPANAIARLPSPRTLLPGVDHDSEWFADVTHGVYSLI